MGMAALHTVDNPAQPPGQESPTGLSALEELDRDALGSGQEGDAGAGSNGFRAPREDNSLGLQVRAHRIDVLDLESEVVEALVGMRRPGARLWILAHVQNKDVGASQLQIDAWLALLHAADHLGTEHSLVEGGR